MYESDSPQSERRFTRGQTLTFRLSIIFTFVLLQLLLFTFIHAILSGPFNIRNYSRQTAGLPWNKGYASHVGPIARVDQLHGNGRIYLVQMGDHNAPYSINDFSQWLHSKYSLDVIVLPAMTVDKSAWDSVRRQYVAELLFAQIKHEHPDLAADKDAYLIGLTDANMFSVWHKWRASFTQRNEERTAIISAYGMQDKLWGLIKVDAKVSNQHFQARLRRILLKDVAMLYWHLQPNNDPTSLLHQTLDPDFPAEDIYESDLDPTRTQWGQYQGEPCMFFNYSAKDSLKPLQERLIRTCSESIPSQHDESVELFQVDLRLGLLIDKHTDFNLPDTIPIRFQRVTRDGWKGLHPFGISGTDNYDKFLLSADNINFTIEEADGGATNLVGNPRWLAGLWPLKYDSLVKYVDADFSGKYYEMRWHPTPLSHYEVKRYDGEIENYCTCDTALTCYQTGYRNSQGQEIKFDRDKDRKLTQLTSPNQSWLHFSYGPSNHIAQIDDSQGRTVHYGYDERNRLISVTYPDGEVYHYEYDNTQHLLTFSVAPDAETTPRLVLRNEYEDGRIAKQTFADGRTYSYNYTLAKNGAIREASVHTPDGRIFKLEISEWDSTIREQDTHPAAERSLSTPK